MKKILIIVLVLSAAGYSFAENLLVNPGFEKGNIGWFGDAGFNIPGWTFWGTDGWCHNNAGAYFENRAILTWSDSVGVAVYQDIPVIAGNEYNFSAYMYSPSNDANGLHGRDAYFSVEWYDSNPPVYEGKIYTDDVGIFYGALTDSNPIDPYDTWKNVSAVLEAPTPAVVARIYLHQEINAGSENGTGGVVCWDNIFAGTGPDCGTSFLAGDVNKDCYVNFTDFAQMAENWLKCNDVFNDNCQ
ncbi:MAG: hypothetical protein BWY69_01683 [Planctomycetes bacterium ADurb.Bin401]|nr:MAG: hypothetical protein BWY69_01683 [Planctomycetes bacterium ADurb.Bin401]